MRIYTLQPLMALATLDAGLTYRPREDLSRRDGFASAYHKEYRWMSQQLSFVSPRPAKDALPIWGKTTPITPPRPLERPRVLFELEIAPERLLLSNLEAWHKALIHKGKGKPLMYQQCLDKPFPPTETQAVFWEIRPDDIISLLIYKE